MNEHDRIANEALERVTATFFGGAPRKRQRAKPNRCRACQKVTRYIFCQECYHERARCR